MNFKKEIKRILGYRYYEGVGTDFTAQNIIDLHSQSLSHYKKELGLNAQTIQIAKSGIYIWRDKAKSMNPMFKRFYDAEKFDQDTREAIKELNRLLSLLQKDKETKK